MARYLNGPSVLRFETGRAIVPRTEFSRVFRPEHEAALLAGGAIERLDSEDVITAEWIDAGFVEPAPEPDEE